MSHKVASRTKDHQYSLLCQDFRVQAKLRKIEVQNNVGESVIFECPIVVGGAVQNMQNLDSVFIGNVEDQVFS